MSMELWSLYAGAVFLLCGIPGPNMLHILTRSVGIGFRRTGAAMAGCLSALVVILVASAMGLTTLLAAYPVAFDVLRYAGVAYLVHLGVKAWRSRADAPLDVTGGSDRRVAPATVFRGGFMTGISNPKTLLFVAAFLPQFIDQHRPQAPQFAMMIATFVAIEAAWYVVYAAGGRSLAHYLVRPAMKAAFNRATGGLFMGFGISLLVAH